MTSRPAFVLAVLALCACGQDKQAEKPPPAPYDAAATAQFCGMALGEHRGPKGQIWLEDQKKPLWFTSVHDTIAFTMLSEEPKNIRAIYVSDMANAPSWAQAELGGWVDAEKAFYVVGSGVRDDMGTSEAVPFSARSAAEAYARDHGGRVVTLKDIPKDQILDAAADSASTGSEK